MCCDFLLNNDFIELRNELSLTSQKGAPSCTPLQHRNSTLHFFLFQFQVLFQSRRDFQMGQSVQQQTSLLKPSGGFPRKQLLLITPWS